MRSLPSIPGWLMVRASRAGAGQEKRKRLGQRRWPGELERDNGYHEDRA
jgi:hypothetical protein